MVKGKQLLTCEKIVVALFSGSCRIQNVSNGHNIPEDMNVQQYRRHDIKSRSDCYPTTARAEVKGKAVPLPAKQSLIGDRRMKPCNLDLGARRWKVVSARLRPLYLREREHVPPVQ